jgi:hypothetical protein
LLSAWWYCPYCLVSHFHSRSKIHWLLLRCQSFVFLLVLTLTQWNPRFRIGELFEPNPTPSLIACFRLLAVSITTLWCKQMTTLIISDHSFLL